ncbi:MAG: FAD-dependent oxidoreductase [Gammaproteobacteria bacterium]|nr:FAD-dependent oxidoreductase [Gammaproteobacteria bacterium]
MSQASHQTDYDVVIVGAGIHGAGCAQAAAAAGYRTLVLEQSAVASATSSRSSKLVHGGLRYLESLQFRLVAESLRERQLLLNNAPDLVRLVPFYIPVYRDNRRPPWLIGLGLSLYALLGLLRPSTRFQRIARSQWPTLSGLNTDGLLAVYRYFDGQTDDTVLTRKVMQSAESLSARLLCPATFVQARFDKMFRISYRQHGELQTITSAALVNAAGPWLNTVLAGCQPQPQAVAMELVKGSHVLVAEPARKYIFYVEAEDGRVIFIMPWNDATLIGTTEKPFHNDPATVQADTDEVEYLLAAARRVLPGINTTVIDSFAGVRVLPATQGNAFHRPRETILHRNDQLPGMITIVGGKLTGYRATAQKVIDALRPWLPAAAKAQDTRHLHL